jgi:GDP-mannose 6-dehydrogenase
MREGSAVADFLNPPYIILGASDTRHLAPLCELYKNTPGTLYETTIPVAEMVKYFSNCYHALKVGFANEMGTMCKYLGVDAHAVTKIFTSDTKLNISPAYLSPGFAFGGSCLPKDLRAFTYKAKELDLKLPLLESLMPSNAEHIDRAVEMVMNTGEKKIAQLGLSFKAGTDDLREPPGPADQAPHGRGLRSQSLGTRMSRSAALAGSNRQYIEEVIPHIGSVLSNDLEGVLRTAEVVILGNKSASKDQLANYLRSEHIVIDLIHIDKTRRPEAPEAMQASAGTIYR